MATPQSTDTPPPLLLRYKQLTALPGGRWLFSRLVCLSAPYFGSISPRFEELQPGLCRVSMRKRRAVQNHIGTIHAIAMANLCELAAGLTMEASLPKNLRWIPRGMTIEYLKKATTGVSATARLAKTQWTEAQDIGIPVSVTDANGTEVVRAVITMYVSARNAAQKSEG